MLRLLITPRWLALSFLLLLLVLVFGWLGLWQWTRAVTHVESPESVSSGQLEYRQLSQVHAANQPVSADLERSSVVVRGTYVANEQLFVPDRIQNGEGGYWVLTPLRMEGDEVIPVVRGWVPTTTAAAELPGGVVTVKGLLLASESEGLRDAARTDLATDEIAIVSSPELLSRWSGELWQGFVVAQVQRPASDLEPVDVALPTSTSISWQSLAYSVQWWLFAAFAVFFFSRMFSLDYHTMYSSDVTTVPEEHPVTSQPDIARKGQV